ncbi:MAG: patatin-like phospholipase family protein [Clostridia bacterium]
MNTYSKDIATFDRTIPFKVINLIFTGKFKLKALINGSNLENIINKYCLNKKIIDISDIKNLIAIPAVDINSGQIVYYSNKIITGRKYSDNDVYFNFGKVSNIVRSSCSFPGVFEPKFLNDRYLVDGGVRVSTPVNILKKLGVTKVIAINFIDNNDINNYNVLNVVKKSFDIMGFELKKSELNNADLVLDIDISDVNLLDYNKVNFSANIGYEIAKKNMDKIKELYDN